MPPSDARYNNKKSHVQELPGLDNRIVASISRIYACSIKHSLTRNLQLNRVDSLSAYLRPATAPATQQHRGYAGTTMVKTWHTAIAKFATVGPTGASAIFHPVYGTFTDFGKAHQNDRRSAPHQEDD